MESALQADAITKVAVVDPRPLTGSALAALLTSTPGISVESVVGTPAGLLELFPARAARPDVVVLCVHSAPHAGVTAVQLIAGTGMPVLVVQVGEHDAESFERSSAELSQAGAAGIVTIETVPEEFSDAVRKVGAGESLKTAVDDFDFAMFADVTTRYGFTDAELPILGLVAAGLTDRQIAERTGKRVSTVQNQMDSIAGKIRRHRGNDVADRKRRALLTDVAVELGLH